MALTREDLRASIERAGDEHWRTLVAHHENAYPASRPTPGDVGRREAERLNGEGYGDGARWELLESRVRKEGEDRVTLVHRLRDRRDATITETRPYTTFE
jgi:L-amino acid N-acyltransferase YncA